MKRSPAPFPAAKGKFFLFWVMSIILVAGCGQPRPVVESTPIPPPPTFVSQAQPLPTAQPTATWRPTTTPSASPTASPPTKTSVPPTPTAPALPPRPDFGVQIHLHREDLDLIMAQLQAVRATWVKTQVSWKVFEPRPGVYDDDLFFELDQLVNAAELAGLRVMLGVAKAPEWSRTTTEMDGPPQEYARLADFLTVLAGRYRGRVAVYELWNEGNLQREWNGATLHGSEFARLVAAGAAAVRAADPQALVISGAPAPTGINDGVTAVDDRVYLGQALAAGLAGQVDGFGIHPYGWGNPPDAAVGVQVAGVQSHNDHSSFFFLDTIEDYKTILTRAGVNTSVQQLWTTEFGWGTTDGFGADPVPGAEFMLYVNEEQQAQYTLRALEIGRGDPALGPMILWNLNFAPTFGPDYAESAYSLLRPDGSPRPVYEWLGSEK